MAMPDDTIPQPRLTILHAPAEPARPKSRHFGLFGTFLLGVVLPFVLAAWYLLAIAVDQFASTVGFSVRKEEVASPIELFGGIADVASTGSSESDILYEFILSQEMVEALENRLNLTKLFSKPKRDPVFAYDPSGTIEDLHDYWDRAVRVIYDTSTELIEVRVLAFDPGDARAIASGIFDESARLVDELSAIAQEDTINFAKEELERAVERLKTAREAMTLFRTRTQIVDPNADLQGQMGVVNFLQQQLAEALIELDDVSETTTRTDPRVVNLTRRIAAIRSRIAQERESFANQAVAGVEEDYPTLMSEYEGLVVDREYAERAYTAALTSLDVARNNIARQSRYLAAYVQPTLPQTPEYPQRFVLSLLAGLFLVLAWSIMALIYYSLRDRR